MSSTATSSTATNIVSIFSFTEEKMTFGDLGIAGTPTALANFEITKMKHAMPSPHVKKPIENFFMDADAARKIATSLIVPNSRPLWLYGPYGCGKSTLPIHLCALLGRPVEEFVASSTTEKSDLVGRFLPAKSGNWEFRYGILAQAMKEGMVLIISEFDLMTPEEQKSLNDILIPGNPLIIESTGEVIYPHKNFFVIVTANSNNTGDSLNGNIANIGDYSVNDRFSFISMDYMPREDEKRMITRMLRTMFNKKGMPIGEVDEHIKNLDPTVELMLDYADDVRFAYKSSIGLIDDADSQVEMHNNNLGATLSTRTIIEWVKQLQNDVYWEASPLISSLETTFILGQNMHDQKILRRMLMALVKAG